IPPVLTFTPSTLTVETGATVALTVTATDNVGITRGPYVGCGSGGLFDPETDTYTAPSVSFGRTEMCTARAFDAAGNEGKAILRISITGDGEPPQLSFSPAAVSVNSGGTAMSTLTATDNVRVTTGPAVTCTQGSFSPDTGTYTAPPVRDNIMATCTATATDRAGNEGTATLTVSVTGDSEPPELSFSPDEAVADSGGTVMSTLTATDNVDGTITPTVTCTHGAFDLDTGTYTAPVVSVDTTATCTATARDAVGNEGRAVLNLDIVIGDVKGPQVSFTPATLLVGSGGTGMSRISATDNFDGTVAPTVSCSNGGGYDIGTGMFTAPTVAVDTESVCTATATDTAGNEGTGTLTVSIFALLDETPPVLTFSPATLTADSGATVMSTLTATDNAGVTTDPAVTCTHGAFDPDTGTYTAPDVRADTMATCTATAFDAAGNEGTGTLTVSVTGDREPPQLSFSPAALSTLPRFQRLSILTATDNRGITTDPAVTCTHGSFDVDIGLYTAPDVRVDTAATCTATARDAAGNVGTATLTVSITPPPDRTAPVLTFIPATPDEVDSGSTVTLTVVATDNVGVVTGPDVTCTQGSFANNTYTA
ncbi:MAG: hypothetical protein GDA39_08630, partial [Hyphomonadaceae bacterium]|nr:hypothetical protein [Hyphomonadaceae bacterium]